MRFSFVLRMLETEPPPVIAGGGVSLGNGWMRRGYSAAT